MAIATGTGTDRMRSTMGDQLRELDAALNAFMNAAPPCVDTYYIREPISVEVSLSEDIGGSLVEYVQAAGIPLIVDRHVNNFRLLCGTAQVERDSYTRSLLLVWQGPREASDLARALADTPPTRSMVVPPAEATGRASARAQPTPTTERSSIRRVNIRKSESLFFNFKFNNF